MTYFLSFTPSARQSLKGLKDDPALAKQFKAVHKALDYLQNDPRHPSLRTHEYYSFSGPNNEKIFEAYAQQNSPAAYRIFFYYGAQRGEIVIFAITQHP